MVHLFFPSFLTPSPPSSAGLQENLPLLVVRALVLQPLAVLLDAANLLTVVVGYGVREALEAGVDPVLLDMLQEFLLTLHAQTDVSPRTRQNRQNRTSRTEQSGTEQMTEQNRTGQDRTGQHRTGQDRTGQNRTEQSRTKHRGRGMENEPRQSARSTAS